MSYWSFCWVITGDNTSIYEKRLTHFYIKQAAEEAAKKKQKADADANKLKEAKEEMLQKQKEAAEKARKDEIKKVNKKIYNKIKYL